MLNIYYNPNDTNSVLIGDGQIEQYILSSIEESLTINISQITIIYVLRKLIAENKINSSDVSVYINNIFYPIQQTGRFNNYPPGNDLFDECLDSILNSISNSLYE